MPPTWEDTKRELARTDVPYYIEVLFNRLRRQSRRGGASPEAFEQALFSGLVVSIALSVFQSLGE